MLLSKKLFIEFFPSFCEKSNDEIEKMLNAIGVEVESVFSFEKTENLCVAEIIECKQHEKSNKLSLCKVFDGNEYFNIVCGAKNARKGIRVILAKIGCKLIDGREIERRKILDVESEGMICAYSELTKRIDFLDDEEKEKIIELDSNAIVGDQNPLKYIGMDDEIFDLSIPSNRNEFNGLIALGFDLINNNFPEYKLNYDFDFSKYKKNNLKLDVDKNISKFYGTIKLTNFKNKKSSWKIKSYLMNSGYKPKNIFVDISNLNTIITGNPSHCYNSNHIGDTISVCLNQKKENIVALDNNNYSLEENSVISIYSKNEIVALGGIVGTKKSSTSKDDESVVFEVANFDNFTIKKSCEKYSFKTDASNIFSKKIPLWITLKSFDSLIHLLEKSNSIFEGISYTDFCLEKKYIDFDYDRIISILGVDLSKKEISKILNKIGFNVVGEKIMIPIYREDIECLHDIVEELVKNIDINNLSIKPIESTLVSFEKNIIEENKEEIKFNLISKGFSLVKTLNLTSKDNLDKFNIFSNKNFLKIINPLSKEREYFRSSLIQQHLEVVANNFSKKNTLVNIYELDGIIADENWKHHLCITICNDHFLNKINNSKIKNDLFLLKSLVQDIFLFFGKKVSFSEFNENGGILLKNNAIKFYVDDLCIGYGGQINPNICKEYKLNTISPIYFVEIEIEEFLNIENNDNFEVSPETNSHKIIRDLTITSNKNSYIDISNIFEELKINNYINNFELESIFKQETKEISYNFSFSLNKEKLKKDFNDQINEMFLEIIKWFERNELIIKK